MVKAREVAKPVKFGSDDPALWVQTIHDMDKFFAGKPSSFTPVKVVPAVPADVKAARKATRLSQTRFAESIGISPVTLRAWENGRRRPRGLETKVIKAIALEPRFAELMAHIY